MNGLERGAHCEVNALTSSLFTQGLLALQEFLL